MVDDNKHDDKVLVRLTEREMLDAGRCAAAMDKKISEYIRYALRLSLYGTIGMQKDLRNETNGDD